LLLECIAARSHTFYRCIIVGVQSHKDGELNFTKLYRLFDKMTMTKTNRSKVALFIIIA
jgi:hypothetical protein